jgi:phage terminase small subunit
VTKFRKFTREYLKDFNATRSAIAVGASKKSAYELGCRWLKKVKASGLYDEEASKMLEAAGVTVAGVIGELAKLARSNIADYIKIDEDGQADVNLAGLSRDQLAAVQEITVDTTGGSGDGERRRVLRTRFKLADKGTNLERLCKYFPQLGLNPAQKHEISGPGGAPIPTAIQVTFVTPDAANS